MKKILLLVFMGLSLYVNAQSADVRINVYGSYVFDDRFSSSYNQYSYYDGKLKGGLQYGGGIELATSDVTGVELLYLRQTTHAPISYNNGTLIDKFTDFDVSMNYIMLSGVRRLQQTGSPIEAYGGLMLGMAIVELDNPDNGYSNNVTKFAWGARLGCNIWAGEKIALKIQGQLLSPVESMGGGLYFGSGGSGANISTYSTIYQFTLGGGLSYKLGN